MKKLNVTIQLEMSVPDDWELVGTSEGTPVLKLPNGVFMDVAIEPLFASDPEETWSSTDDDDVLNDILDMVESEAVTYEFITHWVWRGGGHGQSSSHGHAVTSTACAAAHVFQAARRHINRYILYSTLRLSSVR